LSLISSWSQDGRCRDGSEEDDRAEEGNRAQARDTQEGRNLAAPQRTRPVDDAQFEVPIVFGDEQVDHYPDALTSAEKGLDVNVASFRGIAAPKDTPPEILAALRDACEQTANDPEFIDEMGRFGMEVDLVKGEEFGDWLRRQHETYAEAAEAAGMTAD
jgi:tripartite-type tricarboxylate transporter receptor subunit TctC